MRRREPRRRQAHAWEKPTEQTIALFDSVVPRRQGRAPQDVRLSRANGHMFIGLHENRMILRLGEAERERFVAAFALALCLHDHARECQAPKGQPAWEPPIWASIWFRHPTRPKG